MAEKVCVVVVVAEAPAARAHIGDGDLSSILRGSGDGISGL